MSYHDIKQGIFLLILIGILYAPISNGWGLTLLLLLCYTMDLDNHRFKEQEKEEAKNR